MGTLLLEYAVPFVPSAIQGNQPEEEQLRVLIDVARPVRVSRGQHPNRRAGFHSTTC